ncbi:hypothetical protein [Kosmotoga pacifica]|uniref:Asl1-like glycosyl hydrolase catalytic domain-containing protein n=1 Tax=Kosmotoga pacifica TaxID=1330330 RepID=A0A0G2Z6Y6_9BACT|nr:hypothetical protein [Kosmotoga pacifica]AKI97365.1 hypothetical protein IX53_05520 [Kosmotoga pacifica]
MKRSLPILFIFIAFIITCFSIEMVSETSDGLTLVSCIEYNAELKSENGKIIVLFDNKLPQIIEYSAAVDEGVLKRLSVKRWADFKHDYLLFEYIDNGYLKQEQQESILAPSTIINAEPITSSEKIRKRTLERKDFRVIKFDFLSSQIIAFDYTYAGDESLVTEIGNVKVVKYTITFQGVTGESFFDKNGEEITTSFMGIHSYNLKYFPSKRPEVQKLPFEIVPISPYLFGNNYWKEWSFMLASPFIKNSAIKMIRWGGIFRDYNQRRLYDFQNFTRMLEYTDVEPLVQLEYFSESDALTQLEELLHYIPDLKYISFSNEANIYPIILGKNVSLSEFNERFREEITKIKNKYPEIQIVAPDFTIATFPQYDSWLIGFLKENADLTDVLSLHYYAFDGSQSAIRTLSNIQTFKSYIDSIKTLLKKFGLEGLPLAITEANTGFDYRQKGSGNPSTFEAALWGASAYITAIEENLWSLQLWCVIDDGTLSLLDTSTGKIEYRPMALVYELFRDFYNEIIPVEVKIYGLKAVFAPFKDAELIIGVFVNYSDKELKIRLTEDSKRLKITEMDSGISLKPLSMNLIYFDYQLNPVHRESYSKGGDE